MRSLKPFTRAAENLLAALLLAVLLSACASVGGKPSNDPGSTELTTDGGAEMPTPAVKGGNDSEFEAAVAFIQEGRYADDRLQPLVI